VSGTYGYTVRKAASSGGPFTDVTVEIPATTCIDSGLSDGATWYYTVLAHGMSGAGIVSTPVFATTYTVVEKWRLTYFGGASNSGNAAHTGDPEGDGWRNADEFGAGTSPTDGTSLLKVTAIARAGDSVEITFPAVAGKSYRVEKSATLIGGSWQTVEDNIAGTGNPVLVVVAGGLAEDQCFYRLAVLQ
jgi:hypothetical protein